MAGMFGVIVAGRLVSTEVLQISESQVVFNISEADNINHVVVFMTGQIPFPDGLGGAVYFCWPEAQGASYQLLGHISNDKPSAIFKIANLKKDVAETSHPFGPHATSTPSHMAQIGISLEPLTQLVQMTPALQASATALGTFAQFCAKMLDNFVNFSSSFAVTQAQMTPNPSETYVPLSTLQRWFENFKNRLQQNPDYWKQ